MTTNNKMTYSIALTESLALIDNLRNGVAIAENVDYEAITNRLHDLLASIEKRNSSERKPSKKEAACADRQNHVLELLQIAEKPLSIADIMELDAGTEYEWTSNQQVSGALRGWCKPEVNKVKRDIIDHKTCYSIVK